MGWDYAGHFCAGWAAFASVWSNGLSLMEYYRRPWKHAVWITAGYYAGKWIEAKNDEMVEVIEQRFIKRGVLPEDRKGFLTGKSEPST